MEEEEKKGRHYFTTLPDDISVTYFILTFKYYIPHEERKMDMNHDELCQELPAEVYHIHLLNTVYLLHHH